MKNKSGRLLAVLICLGVFPVVSQAAEKQEASYSLDSHWYVKAYGGYDYSFLDDLVNGTKAWGTVIQGGGQTPIVSADRSGILAGGELGYRLDPDNAISLEAQNIWSSALKAGVSGTTASEADPSLLSFSLNFEHTFFRSPGFRTWAEIGGGYYQANVNYNLDFIGLINANFSQAAPGGMLKIGEEMDLGGSFALSVFLQGRWAVFNQLTASSATVNGSNSLDGGPFGLVLAPLAGSNLLFLSPTSSIGSNGVRYATVDYSGLDGNLALTFSF